ncbi:MAG: sigma-70 family RNA polymerase sigma factor [Planctomycetes bacterium]|nr:sigma-70 family RNA polymerase sigma factor [Planctomycetota bacterium]MCB9909420.1 sigma-70 family RNA polymerase sigma factor [Planctomycetota bacterium]HPF15288.1 sigma-70 family RNA polymerase sigma factor [Planctomycetota bacterium]HRV81765.1 sigma-70 family RNA polymerase sigma factor [Planctomycetota bacterium]
MAEDQPSIERLRLGDEREWGKVQRDYTGRLLRYVAKRVDDHQAREDILQETFLGALRGIATFDERFQFEQYLFGICRNRTIDFLRKRPVRGLGGDEDESVSALEAMSVDDATPSQVFGLRDLSERGSGLLGDALRQLVEETFLAGEWERLKVLELLFALGIRNSHVAKELGIADESAVAGIKFRALKRLAGLVEQGPGARDLKLEIAQSLGDGRMDLDVAETWNQVGAACAHRLWWARWIANRVDPGTAGYLNFHLERVQCEACLATKEDLEAPDPELVPLVERLQASTVIFLRDGSRS